MKSTVMARLSNSVSDASSSKPAPFSTVAAPTTATENLPTSSERFTTFTKFADLPAEIRRKIWRFTVSDPQVVHINYDVTRPGSTYRGPYTYSNGFEARGTWKIENSITITVHQVCQEARAETQHALGKYTRIRLAEDVTKTCLFNFETDTIFLNTNAGGIGDGKDVLPPKFPLEWDIRKELRWLAVSRSLWEDWDFLDDWGSEVTCEGCTDWGDDITQANFKEEIFQHWGLEKLQLVKNSYVVGIFKISDIRFLEASSEWFYTEKRSQIQQGFKEQGCEHMVEVEVVDVDESKKHPRYVNNDKNENSGEEEKEAEQSETESEEDNSKENISD